jgi:hypothetical protein
LSKFFYEHLRDDAAFAAKIHGIVCGCPDGSCGRVAEWRGEVVLSMDDFQETA